MRVEAGRHLPGSHLVHALERVLKFPNGALVGSWSDPAPYGAPARGPRARLARLALNYKLTDIAKACGISAPTISRFERECGDTPLILGPDFERNDGFINDRYAQAHLFADASEMEEYAQALDLESWLIILAERKRLQALTMDVQTRSM